MRVPGPSTARSANAGTACSVTAVTTPRAPSPIRAAENTSGCRVGVAVEHLAGRRHELQAAHLGRQPAEPRPGAVRAGRRGRPRSSAGRCPRDWSATSRAATSSAFNRCSGMPAPTVTSPSSLTSTDPGEAAAGQLDVLGTADAGERVPAADRPYPAAGPRGLRSGRRRPRRRIRAARPRCRRARCRPSCASACGSRGVPELPSRRTPSSLALIPRRLHSAAPELCRSTMSRVDPPQGATGTLRPDERSPSTTSRPTAPGHDWTARPRTSTRRSPSSTWTRSTPTPPTWYAGRRGKPIRVASKSVRSRARAAPGAGPAGLRRRPRLHAGRGAVAGAGEDPVSTDVVVGYPTADRSALRRLAADETARRAGDPDGRLGRRSWTSSTPSSLRGSGAGLRVCLDVDASLRAAGGRVHVGVRRSPLRTPRRRRRARPAGAPAGRASRSWGSWPTRRRSPACRTRPRGRPLRGLAVRGMQTVSARELAARRAEIVAAVSAVAAAGVRQRRRHGQRRARRRPSPRSPRWPRARGCTARCSSTATGRSRRGRRPSSPPPVTRRPVPGTVTVAGGGWSASGPPGTDRLPVPTYPAGLSGCAAEGAGRGADPAARPGDGVAADRRPGLVPAREGRRALRARRTSCTRSRATG